MRPPFSYYGGKARLAPWIAGLLPPHQVYVEPFCGSAAVFFAKQPARFEVINDVHGGVVTFLRTLRDQPDALIRACRLTPYSRQEFVAAAQDDPTLPDVERARRLWIRAQQGFVSKLTPANGWTSSIVCGSPEAATAQRLVDDFARIAQRLTGVIVEHKDALDVIRQYDSPDTCHYIDPPYSGDASGVDGYLHRFGGEDDHRALAEALHRCQGAVLLSGYPGPLYAELYSDWHMVSRQMVKRASNRRGSNKPSTEVIWSNQPIDAGEDLFSSHSCEAVAP